MCTKYRLLKKRFATPFTMKNKLNILCFSLVASQLILGCISAFAQPVSKPESHEAIVITYKTSPSAKTPHAINELPYDIYQHIYADPYRLLVFGTLQNHGGYLLHHMKWNMTFYCLADSTGIAFIPSSTNDRFFASHHSTPMDRHDTIIGLPVSEYRVVFGPDTTFYWSTMAIPTSFHPADKIQGVLLAFEQVHPGYILDHTAIAIDTIQLDDLFVNPKAHLSPLTFDTHIESFSTMTLNMNRPLMEMNNGTVRGSIVNVCPDPITFIEDYKSYAIGSRIPDYKYKEYGLAKRLDTWPGNRGFALILIDYAMLNPVPQFLTDWIAHQQLIDPDFRIAIGTRKVEGLQALIREYPVLETLPHAVLSAEEFVRYSWMDPLTYVVINPDMTIKSITSAFDVHTIESLTSLLKP
jgi:hypothetical protein